MPPFHHWLHNPLQSTIVFSTKSVVWSFLGHMIFFRILWNLKTTFAYFIHTYTTNLYIKFQHPKWNPESSFRRRNAQVKKLGTQKMLAEWMDVLLHCKVVIYSKGIGSMVAWTFNMALEIQESFSAEIWRKRLLGW